MASMTHRERVVRTLSRQEPDRVPLDFGAVASSIDNNAYGRLAVQLGMPDELERADLNDPLNPSKDVTPCAEILEMFDVDTRTVQAASPVDSQAMVQTRIDEFTYRDEWGVIWKRPEHEDGPYMYKQGPFQHDGLTMADIEKYAWPSMPEASDSATALAARARKLHEETDHAIVLSVGHSSVAPCQRLRGFSEFMEDLVLEPGIAEALLEHVTDAIVASTNLLLSQAGSYVDVVSFADDLGLQDRAYFSQKMFSKQVKPHLARCVEAIRKNTNAKVVMHSDGAIFDLIPDLIDIGIDGINPVQTTAWGMDAARLKAEFGDKLAFWGAIDTQHTLPFGSPQDVRDDVKSKIEELGVGGGYVLASCHTIREEVPAENVRAMYESALEFGGY
ncbi:MAG: hypothetical protein FI707_07300 [SAR202 cluster bacterium]|nr:uroporphyrinogen decarboxylase family protein [SAR202 cluster bacterium]HAL48860.1 hypothetical protein [Dehalococcoidia bacterium]MDP6664904.1 uroporphyrinogen decarboxylase family protein [SAR202 cluster bacterium]MDP6799826.1 uroporphyrinogen decarboxylase family protein [SAR202 cluster bacterium]MQG58007.1 hypothetical protein [SAR202 cluster bacterium]